MYDHSYDNGQAELSGRVIVDYTDSQNSSFPHISERVHGVCVMNHYTARTTETGSVTHFPGIDESVGFQ